MKTKATSREETKDTNRFIASLSSVVSHLRTPATFSGDSHEHLHGGCQKVGPKVAKFHEMLEQKRRQATFHRNSTPREESQALNNQRKCS